MITVKTRSAVNVEMRLPGSKSLTHRALIAAALAENETMILGALSCEDTRLTARALEQMGVRISWSGKNIRVHGGGGRIHPPENARPVSVGNSGTSLRFLLSVAGLGRGRFTFTGSPRIHERPVGGLTRSLQAMGVKFRFNGRTGYAPLTLDAAGIEGGPIDVSPEMSSQYVSSLLLAAPYARKDTIIRIQGKCVSRPYVDMTLKVMEAFGASVSLGAGEEFRVVAGVHYRGRPYTVEGDASAGSYFWAAAAVTGGRVLTYNCSTRNSAQGDMRFLDILERMGCRIRIRPYSAEVVGAPLRGVSVDMGDLPDMVPTLAAVALFARGRTVIRNVGHLRFKESDRLDAVTEEWRKIGGRVKVLENGLEIEGGGPLRGALLNPHNDHRIAMSLALVGLRVPGIRIQDPECVSKSFPAFWSLWEGL